MENSSLSGLEFPQQIRARAYRKDKTPVYLMIGTAKGLFRYYSPDRRQWRSLGPVLVGDPVYTSAYSADQDILYAGVNSEFYGASVRRSRDWGETWDTGGTGLTYAADDPEQVSRIWAIRPAEGPTVYAGVEASGLFRSDDSGNTWTEVASLRQHPSHASWGPGYGGKCLHTVAHDPFASSRLYIACSSGGIYRSENAGQSWEPINHGIRAEFMPEAEQYPESGQCVHKFALSPSRAGRIWLQNHGGVYRSDDGGDTWTDVGAPLPSDFGFAVVVHPEDADRAYVLPLVRGPRWSPDNALAVYRTTDAGNHWHILQRKLPTASYTGVLRDAFARDDATPLGLYFGTTSGAIYHSADEGETWNLVADQLPRIYSIAAAVPS